MPELVEVEYYRRLAERVTGRTITDVDAPDPWYLKRDAESTAVREALCGQGVTAVRRRGKLLVLDTTGPSIGLRFGMTGRLVVDGEAAIERLEYSSSRDDPAWTRFRLRFRERGELRVADPRRLGGVELDPDEQRLGVDALDLRVGDLRAALAGGSGPLKARLLDQRRIAGVGNLIADETLWRAALDPGRPAGSLRDPELRRLHRHLVGTIRDLLQRGGSHTGDLHHARARGGLCPRDGAPLRRRSIGGRTTYSCPHHQT